LTTAETVQRTLERLYSCREPFTVFFSGKKSGSVNGTYRERTRTIMINDKNFLSAGGYNGDLLMYTAIHELAHHILGTEMGLRGMRSHTRLFWSVFSGLVDKAEAEGVYTLNVDGEVQGLVDEAAGISRELARLQRELGDVLSRLHGICEKKGIRYEDVLERKLRISRETANTACLANSLDVSEAAGEINIDLQEAIIKERNADRREEIILAFLAGRGISQVKQAGKPADTGPPPEDEAARLMKEWDRLEATIASLQRRMGEIMNRLELLEKTTA
jgi:hypothetical protein